MPATTSRSLETTSHGLALDRVAAVAYDVAILTNVTHEHLELHGTWEAYRDAKVSLFSRLDGRRRGHRQPRRPVGRRVHRRGPRPARPRRHLRHGARPPTSGRCASARTAPACTRPSRRRMARPSSTFGWPAGSTSTTRWPSSPSARSSGWTPAAVREGLRSLEGVPGRMERVEQGQPFGVIVDFAHSPASLTDRPRPARAERGGPRRRAHRRVRLGRGAGHGQAPGDGPHRRRARPARRRHRRGPARRGPRGHPRRRSPVGRRPPASGAGRTSSSSPTGARPSRPRSRPPGPGDIVVLAGKGHETTIAGARRRRALGRGRGGPRRPWRPWAIPA